MTLLAKGQSSVCLCCHLYRRAMLIVCVFPRPLCCVVFVLVFCLVCMSVVWYVVCVRAILQYS